MKIKGLIVLTGVVALMLLSCSKNNISTAKMKTKVDSLSYAFGLLNYQSLKADSLMLNPVMVARAMHDGEREKPQMREDVAREFIMNFISDRQDEQAAKLEQQNRARYKDYIEENEEFLARNKERSNVTVTPSGLQYEVIKMGNGPKPTSNSTVTVHYTGTLIDGTEFDSSVKRGEPAVFPVNQVIPGWTEGLQLMPVGSKFRFYIPQGLAYGTNQVGEFIKPFSTLIFDVELLEMVE